MKDFLFDDEPVQETGPLLKRESYNPQAFPKQDESYMQGFNGMSLLDYFAGQAMQALITRNAQEIWENAYDYAEKMLSERNKRLNQENK